MRNYFPPLALLSPIAVMLCISLFYSCSSDLELPPPPPQPLSSSVEQEQSSSSVGDVKYSSAEQSSSSSVDVKAYCVYQETRMCYPGPYSSCPAGGELSDFCPFLTASSSSVAEGGEQSSSSSVAVSEYGYCVFATDKMCLTGPVSSCPPGGTLSNACPYSSSANASSSSAVVLGSSSSKIATSSSSSIGTVMPSSESQEVGKVEGNVFTDPRDGKKYKFETAPNGWIWMSENLNYSRNNTLGYCYGVDINGGNSHRDSTSCGNGYGRLYEYATAIDGNSPQGLCPNGWHIPSVAEWNTIVGNRKMPVDFYVFSGTIGSSGWKERNKNGFYWTSNGNGYLAGLWHGSGNDIYEVETQTKPLDDNTNYFSIRCIADVSCGTVKYNPATEFCYDGKLYAYCNGKEYDPTSGFCSDNQLYLSCGTETYSTLSKFCYDGKLYTYCNGKEYNPTAEFCSGTTVYLLCDGNVYDPLEGCPSNTKTMTCIGDWRETNCGSNYRVTLKVGECVNMSILEYDNKDYLPTIGIRCQTQNSKSTVSINKTEKTFQDYTMVIPLGKVELGDNEFGKLCLISGTSIECGFEGF